MQPILLLQFKYHSSRQFGRYEFDPTTGFYSLEYYSTHEDASRGCVGWGEERMIGIRSRQKVFVALYTERDNLILRIGGRIFDWSVDKQLKVTRRSVLPFVKRFDVRAKGKPVFCTHYFYQDSSGFPGPEAQDIFFKIRDVARSLREVARFVYYWRAVSQGRDVRTQSFVDEMELQLDGIS